MEPYWGQEIPTYMAGSNFGNIHPIIILRLPTPPNSMPRIPIKLFISFYLKRLLSNCPFYMKSVRFCGNVEKCKFTWYFQGHDSLRNNDSYITKFYVHVPKDLYFQLQLRNNEETNIFFQHFFLFWLLQSHELDPDIHSWENSRDV